MALGSVLVGLLIAGTQPAGATRYQVRRGDTLSEIASHLGVRMSRLATANGLSNYDVVYAGTWLQVPGSGTSGGGSGGGGGGTTHTVRVGETLSGIAHTYGLSTSALAQANGISNPNLVVIGRSLRIPSTSGGGGDGGGYSSYTGSTSGLPKRLRTSPTRLAYIPVFDHWAARYGVPADLAKAVTWLESGWQRNVVSSTGAVGIGQLMPSTVDHMNAVMGTNLSPWDPEDNIRMSVRLLATLLAETGWSTSRTLAGYYQGLASVARNGMYPSTLAYIDGVSTLRSRFG